MRIFDCHSHWSTATGHLWRTDEERRNQKNIWNTEAEVHTEAEMMEHFRRHGARTILDLAWVSKLPLQEMAEYHDYAYAVQRQYPEVIFGHWLNFDPRLGKPAVKEFERGLAADAGFVGIAVYGQGYGIPASDPLWDPFYKKSIEAGVPVLLHTGLTGIGQGFRGGHGVRLDDGHPRHVDEVAARFPDLDILAARPAYPWQDEMIAVLLHKANVQYELHGWSPKHLSDALKREIGTRMQDRIMFGCDFPVLKLEMMMDRWRGLGYSQEVLEKVMYRNAEAFFPGAKLEA